MPGCSGAITAVLLPYLGGTPRRGTSATEAHTCSVGSALAFLQHAQQAIPAPGVHSSQRGTRNQQPKATCQEMGKLATQTNGCQVAQLFQTQINSREASARLPSHPDTVKCLGKTPFNWEGPDPIRQPSW